MVVKSDKRRRLALFSGNPSVIQSDEAIFNWPIITQEDEKEVIRLLRKPNFLDSETVDLFEKEFAYWCGTKYAITHVNGTSGLQAAMYACGVRRGDEVIAPSCTYWATILQCFSLGATMVFADIDPHSLCLDPKDIEKKITEKTKAIVVVHFSGYPCDMDAINAIAKKHQIKVIEDASHAHGSIYKEKKVGTLADVAVFSLCGKPLAVGEGGMLVTDDQDIYEHVIAWCHNFRFGKSNVHNSELVRFAGLPLGGVTARINNLSAALGRGQLKHFDQRIQEVDRAMNYFWDLLADLPGIEAHRPTAQGSTMGGWYCPHSIYHPEELGGLSVSRLVEGLRAEGYYAWTRSCIKEPLHLHPLVNECDIYGDGKPTRIAHANRDVRQKKGSLPVTETIKSFTVPAFKRFVPEVIEKYADLFRKVVDNYEELLEGDRGDDAVDVDERGNG